MAQASRALSTPFNREYNPVEAAYAVAKFFPADPVVWLDRCALAGVKVTLTQDGKLSEYYGDANPDEHTFLSCWLNLTDGGIEAVKSLLRKRQAISRSAPL